MTSPNQTAIVEDHVGDELASSKREPTWYPYTKAAAARSTASRGTSTPATGSAASACAASGQLIDKAS